MGRDLLEVQDYKKKEIFRPWQLGVTCLLRLRFNLLKQVHLQMKISAYWNSI